LRDKRGRIDQDTFGLENPLDPVVFYDSVAVGNLHGITDRDAAKGRYLVLCLVLIPRDLDSDEDLVRIPF